MPHKILELYCGIGGMHCAWRESGMSGEVVTAVDINTIAIDVYKYNFPETIVLNKNIQSLTPQIIKKLNVNTILMSPPCQPFTRNGKCLDDNDPRTNSFIYLIDIMDQLDNIEYILMENVKGFENSIVRTRFINKLIECQFVYQEFLLNPTSVGIPNSRLRYYCIAKKSNLSWSLKKKKGIMTSLDKEFGEPFALKTIIDHQVPETFLLNNKQLKKGNIIDICYRDCRRSCCFTKAYTYYLEGTGSVFTEAGPELVKTCYNKANTFEVGSDSFIDALQCLRIRFFTPKEVLSLMAFPKYFSFPQDTTLKQCYRLLGNSINVKVVSELIKILFTD